jgi:hypothetical protein
VVAAQSAISVWGRNAAGGRTPIVPGHRRRQGVDVVRVALDDGEPCVAALDLGRRADECRDRVSAREGEIDELCADVSGGTNDEGS